MAIDRSNNPMSATSTTCTLSVFFSTPVEVMEMRWEHVNATSSCPLVLRDMDGNQLFRSSTSADMHVFEDPRVFATGLVIGSSSTAASSTTMSTCLTVGKLFVWVR